jgi:hypothetical protein
MLSARSSPVEPVGNSLVLLSGSVLFMKNIIYVNKLKSYLNYGVY